MQRIKQHKFIWFSIILIGVILIGIPAAVYAQDEPFVNEWVGSSDGEVNYDADSDGPDYALGSTTGDFVFTPVNPCRIFDTREAGGKIPTGGTRSFFVHGSALTGQGGNPAGCSSPVGEPRGVLLNIVAVNSTAPGYLTVWPFGTAKPLAGVLNYSPYDKTDPISNAFAVKTAYNAGFDISVYAFRQTHVVADVLGYFSMPEATSLQTSIQTSTVTIAANGLGGDAVDCPSGYKVTGGGCQWDIYSTSLILNGSRPLGDGWRCDGRNGTDSARGLSVFAVCSRVPGR